LPLLGVLAVADDCFIAPMPAEIDVGNAARVRADLLSAVNHSKVVIADLGRTSFCDCAGVSALLTAGSYAARTGAELLIVARSRAVLRTFELTGLPLRLAVYATCAEAQRGPPRRGSPVASILSYRRTGAAGSVRRPGRLLAP
jgi:anti-anti-sigma factor